MSHASELHKILKKSLKERRREKDKKVNPGAFLGGEENLQKERTGMNIWIPGNKAVPKKETNQKKQKKA